MPGEKAPSRPCYKAQLTQSKKLNKLRETNTPNTPTAGLMLPLPIALNKHNINQLKKKKSINIMEISILLYIGLKFFFLNFRSREFFCSMVIVTQVSFLFMPIEKIQWKL